MRHTQIWDEAGMRFVSNILTEVGDSIPLHKHSYGHVAVVHGWLKVTETAPDGSVKEYTVANRGFKPNRTDIEFLPHGWKLMIPAMHQHTFEVLDLNGPANVLCFFPVGA